MSTAKEELPESGTVTVACKLPHGIIIRDRIESSVNENILGGGTRKVKVFRPTGPLIRIKGPTVPSVFIRHVEVVGGYAITEGVDAKIFKQFMKDNQDSPFVRNFLIYGDESRDKVLGWAKERAEIKSGVEALDVSLTVKEGRQVFKDERIARSGADQVTDGKLEAAVA